MSNPPFKPTGIGLNPSNRPFKIADSTFNSRHINTARSTRAVIRPMTEHFSHTFGLAASFVWRRSSRANPPELRQM